MTRFVKAMLPAFDKGDALHARKGNVRFYLDAGKGKQAALTKLGGVVAAQL